METQSYSVRCIFQWSPPTYQVLRNLYEERITLWQAGSIDEAIERAEKEAADYMEVNECEFIGLSQAFALFDSVSAVGQEVFSLLRESDLEPTEYLDRFFETGYERENTGLPTEAFQRPLGKMN